MIRPWFSGGAGGLGVVLGLTLSCAPLPRQEAPSSEPLASSGAASQDVHGPIPPGPSASAAVALPACNPGEWLDRCDCAAGKACFDICCGPDDVCAHPSKPGGLSACLRRPKALLPSVPRLVFACEEKYSLPACDEVSWLATQRDQAGQGLLEHEQGGPDGAVWNGDAALWIGVPKEARSTSFGGGLEAGRIVGGRRWFKVEPAVWRKRLRKVAGKPYQAIDLVVEGHPVGAFWFAEGE